MDKELTTLSSKGQLVIPKVFRQKLKLEEGDFMGMALVDDVIAVKKVEVPKEKVEKKVREARRDREFTFEELLYPKKE